MATVPPPPPPPSLPRPCPDLFAENVFPTYELTVSPKDWAELEAQYRSGSQDEIWHPAGFRMGSEVVGDAMIRLRGGTHSLCGTKMQFAISFNEVNPDARFHGVHRIDLDHGGCRLLTERLAFSYMRDLGIPAPCANHARLFVNGAYYGLFTNLEHTNKDFLTRNFGTGDANDGNLYKYARELKTNENSADTSDLDQFLAAGDFETVRHLVDLKEAVLEWAAEAALPASDNFWLYNWNFYVYHHPTRGFLFLPNDIDESFALADGSETDNTIFPARYQHPADIVMKDPEGRAMYLEALKKAIDAYDVARFDDRIDRWWDQVRDAALADPFHAYSEGYVSWFKERVNARRPVLDVWRDNPPGQAPPGPPGPNSHP